MHGRAPLSVHACAFVSTLRFHQEEKIQYVFFLLRNGIVSRWGGGGGVKGSWLTCLKKE